MGLRNQMGTDKDLVVDGVWVELPNEDRPDLPYRFKIAYMSPAANKDYDKTNADLTKPYRRKLNSLGNDVMRRIGLKSFVGAILKDWENIYFDEPENADAVPDFMEFTEENALTLLREIPDTYEWLLGEAGNPTNFKMASPEDNDAAGKTLPNSSDTNLNSATDGTVKEPVS